MAMAADSSPNHHHSLAGDGVSSPNFRQRNLASPWARVVRGDPESVSVHRSNSPTPSSSSSSVVTSSLDTVSVSDFPPSKALAAASSSPPPSNPPGVHNLVVTETLEGTNNNASGPKKPAWNKPSNGVVEVSPVMGAVSWPALSESTKASLKSPSADVSSPSPKIVIDESVSTSQGPVIPHSPQKQPNANVKSNSTSNHSVPLRQRSMKRGGSGGGGGSGSSNSAAQSSFTHPPPRPPPPPPFPVFPMPPNTYGSLVAAMPDHTLSEPPFRGNNWDNRPVGGFVPQPRMVNDHRNTSRRGNFGPRGDVHYHNNYGGRRDQDRGNYVNARDVHVQSPRASPRGYVRPLPANTATFVSPQPVRPFASPMGFPEVVYIPTVSLEPFRGMPFITHPPSPHAPSPAMLMPVQEPPLSVLLLHQIEYYFSDANLVKDDFLKSNMDDQGWVPITLIAGFNRVKNLTNNVQLILDSLRTSAVVEVQDVKVRRRNEWMRWIPSSNRLPNDSSSPSLGGSTYDMLETSFQKITVDESGSEKSSTDNLTFNLEDGSGRCLSELSGQN